MDILNSEGLTEGNETQSTTELIEMELPHERRIRALRRLAELPPALPDVKDGAKYIHDMRQAEGLRRIESGQKSTASILIDLANTAEKLNVKSPRDLSAKHDNYLWDE